MGMTWPYNYKYTSAFRKNGADNALAQAGKRAPSAVRHRRVFLVVLSAVLILCLAQVIFGIIILAQFYPGINNPTNFYYGYASSYTFTTSDIAGPVFLWLTIPVLMMFLAIFELVRIWRFTLPSLWFPVSAAVGFAVWGVQFSIVDVCLWTYGRINSCPWQQMDYNEFGLLPDDGLLMWSMPWVLIVVLAMYLVYFAVALRLHVLAKRERRAPAFVPQYNTAYDSASLITVPSAQVAESLPTDTTRNSYLTDVHRSSTLRTSASDTRPPSYFSGNHAYLNPLDEKDEKDAKDIDGGWI